MIFRFLEYQLDARRFELRRGAERLPVARGSMDALLYLVKHRDRVVSRGEMMDQLWPNVAVQERVVDQTIYTARKLLADDARAPRAIETSRGRGWRFIAQVVESALAREQLELWPPGEAPFVGRCAELELLTTALDAARAGRGSLLVLHSAPGLGKSRLLAEFGARATLLPGQHYAARCPAHDFAPCFWPWLHLLRAHHTRLDGAGLRVKLARTLEFAELPAERAAHAWCEAPRAANTAQRFAFFGALTQFWKEAAERHGPLLLAFDDLHRTDPLSLDFLNHLTPELAAMPMLVLASARPANFGALRFAGAKHIELAGFDESESRAFVAGAWSRAPGADEFTRLCELSEGNPSLLGQLLLHAGAPPPPGVRLPNALRSAVLEQLASAPPEMIELLKCAAVMGLNFEVELLCALSGQPRAEALALLDTGHAHSALAPPPAHSERFRFNHRLLRDALYETLGVAQREALHERLAALLRERGQRRGPAREGDA